MTMPNRMIIMRRWWWHWRRCCCCGCRAAFTQLV